MDGLLNEHYHPDNLFDKPVSSQFTSAMAHDEVPERLGDFEIVREIGRGGMGVVYEARQISLNRNVALKVLAPGLDLSAAAVTRFGREAEAAARLLDGARRAAGRELTAEEREQYMIGGNRANALAAIFDRFHLSPQPKP